MISVVAKHKVGERPVQKPVEVPATPTVRLVEKEAAYVRGGDEQCAIRRKTIGAHARNKCGNHEDPEEEV